jgi:hypothetical protein
MPSSRHNTSGNRPKPDNFTIISQFGKKSRLQDAFEVSRRVVAREHSRRVSFEIIHDYTDNPEECAPGEEPVAVIMTYRNCSYWIPWSPTHLLTFDFICRHRRIPLDAWSIAAKMQLDPFVLQNGANAPGNIPRPARCSRTGIRQQIKRMREVLRDLFEEEGIDLNAWDIIRSIESSTRTVRYLVDADVTWRHWPGSEGEDSGACIVFGPNLPLPEPALVRRSKR